MKRYSSYWKRTAGFFMAAVFVCVLSAGAKEPEPAAKLYDGDELVYYCHDFKQEDGALYLPLRESSVALGMDGFADDRSRTVFFRHKLSLVVIKSDKGTIEWGRKSYDLSHSLIWTDEKVYLPSEVFTGVLSDVLKKEIRIEHQEAGAADKAPKEGGEGSSFDTALRNPVDVIAIDPGHGGSDTGATGPGGIKEKDVTLQISLKLAEKLRDQGIEVYLTREKDVKVPLAKRPEKARRKDADVFISIHANGYKMMSAKGFETFFASLTATDQAAMELATWENQGSTVAEDSPDEVQDDIAAILGDMAQAEWLADSGRLAEMVQVCLARVMNSENRGVKQAPFKVLMDASMPAVLVEVGFITSPEEAKMITDPKTQAKLVDAMALALLRFRDTTNRRLGLDEK
ncbi:MAG: N-acetylmuramoyl-L-alanine amidase [bacterium]